MSKLDLDQHRTIQIVLALIVGVPLFVAGWVISAQLLGERQIQIDASPCSDWAGRHRDQVPARCFTDFRADGGR